MCVFSYCHFLPHYNFRSIRAEILVCQAHCFIHMHGSALAHQSCFFFFLTSLCNKDAQIAMALKRLKFTISWFCWSEVQALAKTDSLLRLPSGYNQAISWVVLFSEAGDLLKNLLGHK